jgi:hypothetical protein
MAAAENGRFRNADAAFEAANARAAAILLASPDRYPGVLQAWAKLFFARYTKGEQITMSTQFAAGRYRVCIESQRFIQSSQKGTLGFELSFRVTANADQPDAPVKPFQRGVTLWISDQAAANRALQRLQKLGYPGQTLTGIDPDTENSYDFCGTELELICQHETQGGGTYERWDFPVVKSNLKDKSLIRKFDRMLKEPPDSSAGPNGGITDTGRAFLGYAR